MCSWEYNWDHDLLWIFKFTLKQRQKENKIRQNVEVRHNNGMLLFVNWEKWAICSQEISTK